MVSLSGLLDRQTSTSTASSSAAPSVLSGRATQGEFAWRFSWSWLRQVKREFPSSSLSSATSSAAEPGLRVSAMLEPCLQRLSDLAQLDPNWDSYGGLPPSERSVRTSRRLIEDVAGYYGDVFGNSVWPYVIMPLAAGGVQLEWRGPGGDLEIEVGRDGELGYLYIRDHRDHRQFEEGDELAYSAAVRLVARVLMPAMRA